MRMFALALCGLLTLSTAAAADPTVNINSRGQNIRVVLLKPSTAAVGSVILLAGGNGRLDITAGGEITKLTGNQLVRTRAKYRAKGYYTLVPDLAPDMKVGSDDVVSGYRVSLNYAKDIGAMVKYLRQTRGGAGGRHRHQPRLGRSRQRGRQNDPWPPAGRGDLYVGLSPARLQRDHQSVVPDQQPAAAAHIADLGDVACPG